MVEVNNKNFSEIYPDIVNDIKECNFVAFDLEYISLNIEHHRDFTLFDTIHDRYEHIKDGIKLYTPFQIGISVFKREQIPNLIDNDFTEKYLTKMYKIHVCPVSLDVFDTTICPRTDRQNWFKVVGKGVSFMNTEEFNKLKSNLEIMKIVNSLSEDQKDFLEQQRETIAEFLDTDDEFLELKTLPGLHNYFHQRFIRSHYLNLSTTYINNKIKLEKVSSTVRLEIDQMEEDLDPKSMKYDFCMEMLGVSQLFKLISQLKKPIVGYNCFINFVVLYQKFFHNLPSDSNEFCCKLHNLMPKIFDTEFIFSQMRMKFSELGGIDGGLEALYNYLAIINHNRAGFGVKIESNLNVLGDGDSDSNNNPTNDTLQLMTVNKEGNASFKAGCCLLYLANMLFQGQVHEETIKLGVSSSTTQIDSSNDFMNKGEPSSYYKLNRINFSTFETYENLLKPWSNCVSVEQSHDIYVKLDGDDHKIAKPNVFCLEKARKQLNARPYWLVVYDGSPKTELQEEVDAKINITENSGDQDDINKNDENGDRNDKAEEVFLCQNFLEQLLYEFGDTVIYKLKPIQDDEKNQHFMIAMSSYNDLRSFQYKTQKIWPHIVMRKYCKWTDDAWYRGLLIGATTVSSFVSCVCIWSLIKDFMPRALFRS